MEKLAAKKAVPAHNFKTICDDYGFCSFSGAAFRAIVWSRHLRGAERIAMLKRAKRGFAHLVRKGRPPTIVKPYAMALADIAALYDLREMEAMLIKSLVEGTFERGEARLIEIIRQLQSQLETKEEGE